MQVYKTEDIRNIALLGHGSSGKTMLSEAMLACGGKMDRMGTIEAGSTVSDYHEDEQARQISISSSLLHVEWNGKKINVIDAPGYSDFVGEAIGALAVSDTAVIVVGASQGIQVGTEQMWQRASQRGLPKVVVMTGLDKEHVDFDGALQKIRAALGKKVFPMLIPTNAGLGFTQVADVLRKTLLTFKTDGSGKYNETEISGDLKEEIDALHQELIEYVAESNDSLLEKFFEQGGLSEDELKEGLHAAFQAQSFIPLYPVSGPANIGVARLLDFVANYGSAPSDHPAIEAKDAAGKPAELPLTNPHPVLYIFKTLSEPHVGELSFFRVYSGKVSTGMDLLNTRVQKSERLGQVYLCNGKNRTHVDEVLPGDIATVVKLKSTHTGDTLCDAKHFIEVPAAVYPGPNVHAAIKPRAKSDEDKVGIGLAALRQEDPTFQYRVDPEVKQTIMSGQGELHLQVALERLKKRFNIELDLLEPRIPYRETIKTKGDSKYRHKKQTGGAGQFAEVWMTVEPLPRGSGLEFTQSLVGQNVDRVFVPSVEKGVHAAGEEGILAGCKVVDCKVNFYDGKMHPVDSKDIAFQIAGKEAFKEAFLKAKPCLLEPIYNLTVKVPEEYMGDVMGDVSSRRGKIQGMDTEGSFQVVKAQVPQANLYQYATTLRSLTGGRGLFSQEFSHYAEMPKETEEKVVAENKKTHEA